MLVQRVRSSSNVNGVRLTPAGHWVTSLRWSALHSWKEHHVTTWNKNLHLQLLVFRKNLKLRPHVVIQRVTEDTESDSWMGFDDSEFGQCSETRSKVTVTTDEMWACGYILHLETLWLKKVWWLYLRFLFMEELPDSNRRSQDRWCRLMFRFRAFGFFFKIHFSVLQLQFWWRWDGFTSSPKYFILSGEAIDYIHHNGSKEIMKKGIYVFFLHSALKKTHEDKESFSSCAAAALMSLKAVAWYKWMTCLQRSDVLPRSLSPSSGEVQQMHPWRRVHLLPHETFKSNQLK